MRRAVEGTAGGERKGASCVVGDGYADVGETMVDGWEGKRRLALTGEGRGRLGDWGEGREGVVQWWRQRRGRQRCGVQRGRGRA